MNKYIKISTLVLLTTLLTFANASENNLKNKELKVSNQSVKTVGAKKVSANNAVKKTDSTMKSNNLDLEPGTIYDTGANYENNIDETEFLFIPNAENLVVTITGSIEGNADFLTITDENGNETVLTGALNESFIVDGSGITVRFTSDESITDEGACVTIEKVDIENNLSYETGANYGNNIDETEILFIPDAKSLLVTITGSIEENADLITITDENGNETVLTGALNEGFIVDGSSITVRFTSDESITDEGACVTIEKVDIENNLSYETGANYGNNLDESQLLTIPNAELLTVTVTGSIEEGFDFLTITEENGNETNLTGALGESFIVDGSSVLVRFTSDESNTDIGAIVTIEEAGVVGPQ